MLFVLFALLLLLSLFRVVVLSMHCFLQAKPNQCNKHTRTGMFVRLSHTQNAVDWVAIRCAVTVLCARICQLFPKLSVQVCVYCLVFVSFCLRLLFSLCLLFVQELVSQFFQVYAYWPWATTPVGVGIVHTVCVCSHMCVADSITGRAASYRMEFKDRVCVLTTNRPYRNSARNVTLSTRNVMVHEFKLAANVRL